MGIRTNDELGGHIGGDTTGTTKDNKRGLDVSLLNDTFKVDPEVRSQTELIAAISLTNELLVKIEIHLQEITNLTGIK